MCRRHREGRTTAGQPGGEGFLLGWLLVIVAMPFLALFSLAGLVVWLVLLPVKIICCPIGCLIQIMADLVENVIKAPFKLLLYASGKPYKKREPDVERQ